MPDAPAREYALTSIVAATDLTESSLGAVQAGALLAGATGAALHALHVRPDWDDQSADLARSLLEQQVHHVVSADTPVTLHVKTGTPFDVISSTGAALGADLVVLGGHRPRRVFDGLLGTTADRVVRTSSAPVLVVSRTLTRPPRRVVICTDLSPLSDRALDLAISWLRAWSGDGSSDGERPLVELLHVSAFAHPSHRPGFHADGLRERARMAENAGGGRFAVRPRILSAPLAPEGIQIAADEMQAELIVLGTHGHGTLTRTLIGSVASEVARTLPFPVLLVPPAG
jgi:universal stress protein E